MPLPPPLQTTQHRIDQAMLTLCEDLEYLSLLLLAWAPPTCDENIIPQLVTLVGTANETVVVG